jgi:hypothetical protein
LADLEGRADKSSGGFEEGVKLQIMFFGNRKIHFLLRKIKKVVFLRNRNM